MLIRNGSNFNNLSFLGGKLGSLDFSQKNKSHVNNGLTFGSKITSVPTGYFTNGIKFPISYGGIGARLTGTTQAAADMTATADMAATLEGQGNVIYTNLAGGYNLGATLNGVGSLESNIQATAKIAAMVRIGANPSADDFVYALMDTPTGNVETDLTLRDALRILVSIAAGKTSIENTTVTFRDVNDSKDRVTATMSGSERISVDIEKG